MNKILFVGDLNSYGRGYQRFRTLMEIGHLVTSITHTKISPQGIIEKPSFLFRFFNKIFLPLDNMNVNKKILLSLNKEDFDILWIEKGNMIHPWTLIRIKKKFSQLKIISCSEDDMFVSHGYSLWYKYGLRYYDYVFTTKLHNLLELKNFGANCINLFIDSYDEKTHKPIKLNRIDHKRFSCEVSAIGAYEKERANSLLYLAKQGIKVNIWGNGWSKMLNVCPNLIVKDEFLFGEDYTKAICASKININFLRKINRDEVTSRSMEIPACGAFMLAERTSRHLSFFREGKEADFFSSDSELLLKIKYYLSNQDLIKKIAKAGHERCKKSGYSMRSQLLKIINIINS